MFRQISRHEDINMCKLIIKEQDASGRQYTLPSASQAAAIIVGSEEYHDSNERHIIVETTEGHLVNIQEYAGFYNPLQYPLLLPYDTYNWIVSHLYHCRYMDAVYCNTNVGQRVILPSSFVGSPRDMYQRYQDAMAVVQHYGRPDIFLTMTCNTSWQDITDALYVGQTPQDRPDVVSRIFHAKYEKLKKDIFKKNVLGKTVSHVHVIEFQKRGLPHVHMLVIFDARDKMNTPDDYDKIVRAELPHIEHEPELYNAVVRHMIHGPYALIEDELSIPISSTDLNSVALLNPAQCYAFHTITEAITQHVGGIFFIDGPGGTGKTFLYKALLPHLRQHGHIVLATASSGIAETLLPGGTTAHLRFKIPISVEAGSFCKFGKQSEMHKLIQHCSAILWDEAPMSHKHVFEAVDRSFRDVLNVTQPFGGKVVIMGGDFRQVPPVVVNGTKFQIIKSSILASPLWLTVQLLSLSQNMRALDDQQFANFLLRVGNGEERTYDHDMIQMPTSMIIPWEGEHSINVLINTVFSDITISAIDYDHWENRALLTPLNEDVNYLNEKCLNLLIGDEITYYSFDSVDDDRSNLYPEEFLNSISLDTLPPHKLSLKKGSPIMLLRNLILELVCAMGQTISQVGLYLPSPVFTHGQLYVALSREVTARNTKVLVKDGSIPGHPVMATHSLGELHAHDSTDSSWVEDIYRDHNGVDDTTA
ncbi:hypothetical protein KSP39_PZI016605 [Platanthera zijinensis]|uniref:ATP-dependent DNA helicase n=1 Tax=Platanthera zijinensis TaxID=2320716 RepID=A0AAP0B844_9ASPA